MTTSDCKLPAFRLRCVTTPEEVRSFDDIVQPSPTNTAAEAWTLERLQILAKTIARINES